MNIFPLVSCTQSICKIRSSNPTCYVDCVDGVGIVNLIDLNTCCQWTEKQFHSRYSR